MSEIYKLLAFQRFEEIIHERCAMRKNYKKLEFQLSPKFSDKKKNHKNEEISGLDLATRTVI